MALDQGADALEMDVQVSADWVPLIIHDRSTGRIGDVDVPIEASTTATLQGIDAGSGFTADGGQDYPWRGRGVVLSTLSKVLARFAAVLILLELKSPRGQEEVRHMLGRYGARRPRVAGRSRKDNLRAQ